MSLTFFEGKVWIINYAQGIAKQVNNRPDANIAANILNGILPACPQFQKSPVRGICIGNTPVGYRTRRSHSSAGFQSKLKAANFKTNIERLVKVRLDAQNCTVPCLCLRNIFRPIDDCPQTLKHVCILSLHTELLS